MHTIKQHFSLSYVSHKSRMKHSMLHSAEVQGTATRNAARLWPGASNMAIRRSSSECERKDHFENRAKNQMAVFKSSTVLLQKVETK